MESTITTQPQKPQSEAKSVRILISNMVAGAMIGKQGQNLQYLQETHRVRVKITGPNEFYPGTTERLATIVGAPDSVSGLLRHLVTSNPSDWSAPAQEGHEQQLCQVKFVVADTVAGGIIGRGGVVVRGMMEQTGARIHLSAKQGGEVQGERTVTVSGQMEGVLHASSLVATRVLEDDPDEGVSAAKRPRHSTSSASGGPLPTVFSGAPSSKTGGGGSHPPAPDMMKNWGTQLDIFKNILSVCQSTPTITVDVHVPDAFLVKITHPGSRVVQEIVSMSRAAVTMGARTDKRTIVVQGDLPSVVLAQFLINVAVKVCA